MKKLLALALALGLLLGMCSFAQADGDVITITVWSDNAHEKVLRDQQVEEFNNTIGKEKGIFIKYDVYGDNYSDSIKIAARTDEAPDMFRADTKWMQDFVDAGYVVPLKEFPGSEELLAKYDGLLAKQYHIFNGEVYTLPYNLTTYKFVVNVDLFKAAGLEVPYDGWTWDQVREYAKKITDVSAGKAYGYGLSLKAAWTLSSYVTMPAGCNIGHYGYDWVNGKFAFADLSPIIEVLYNMAQVDGSVFPGFEGLDGDGVRAQFSAGRIGIMGAASFDAAVYNEQFPAQCEWAVVPEPSITAEGHPYKEFVQPTQLLVMGKKALEHPEAALTVFNYFYSDECAAAMYEQGLYVPIRQEAIDMATKQPDAKGFADFANIEQKFVMGAMPDTLITYEGDAYRDVIIKILSGQLSSDVRAEMEKVDAYYNKGLEALTPEQLNLFSLPEGTKIERE